MRTQEDDYKLLWDHHEGLAKENAETSFLSHLISLNVLKVELVREFLGKAIGYIIFHFLKL